MDDGCDMDKETSNEQKSLLELIQSKFIILTSVFQINKRKFVEQQQEIEETKNLLWDIKQPEISYWQLQNDYSYLFDEESTIDEKYWMNLNMYYIFK